MAPNDVDRLLAEYVSECRGGGAADPTRYLDQLHGAERAELELLIDRFLLRQPRRSFDAATFRGSPAELLVESLDASLRGQAGFWPALLPRLRHDAQLKRSDVVEQLAEALGATEQSEKVAGYYHRMEQGLLPPAGVSDKVLDALAKIVNVSAAALRRAGGAITPAGASSPADTIFARAVPAPERDRAAEPISPGIEPARDDIDRLFLGDA
jgi:hypothetical protein